MTLSQITSLMHDFEISISFDQRYIAKHGAKNDLNPDLVWTAWKADANRRLLHWDVLKGYRDAIKTGQTFTSKEIFAALNAAA